MGDILQKLIDMAVRFPLFLIAIMFHEVAHGYAALRCGDPTAKNMGRLTLNPMAHVDPTGLVVFVITSLAGVGFGWAKPVPVRPALFRDPKRDIIIVSLAGVAANLALIIATIFVIKLLSIMGLIEFFPGGRYAASSVMVVIFGLLRWFMLFNGILFVFNLLPIPPLDGSKVLMALLPREQAMAFASIERHGTIIIFGLLFIGALNFVFYASMSLVNSLALFVFMM